MSIYTSGTDSNTCGKEQNPSEQTNLYSNFDINVWLRSCEQEILKPVQGTTFGNIPSWINGSLIRNGPGLLKIGDNNFGHYFDCPALLHRFNIEKSNITYQCKFLQSDVFKRNAAANRIVLTEFGTRATPDPSHTIFQRMATVFNSIKSTSDNSLVSVYPFGDEIYACGEVPVIHRIDKQSLETEAAIKLGDYVSVVHHSAHPHVMRDGTVYNLGLSISLKGPCHIIVKFPPKSGERSMFDQASVVAKIPARWTLHPAYMHTFGITDNYFIIIEQPLSLSVLGIAHSKLKNKPIGSCFQWNKDKNTQINVISRKTGKVAYKFYAEAFCYMHIINQYETCDHIVIDICTYRDASMLDCMYIKAMESMHENKNYADIMRSKVARFTLPLNLEQTKNFVTPEIWLDAGCELPAINYNQYLGKPYRYFYAINADVDSPNPGGLIKVDTLTKTSKLWQESDCYLSEPVFVARPNCQFEDDGVILSVMLWGGDSNCVGLLALDAARFEEIGRTTFRTPGPTPRCLHGWFYPN